MQTIGMDTYGFVAGVVVDAALNVLTQQDRMLTVVQSVWGPMLSPSWAGKRRSNRPFAHAGSPRDNPHYRAAFSRVETTDDRAKRPTMGGSNEPPFLLP